jgi:phage terminase small subunit
MIETVAMDMNWHDGLTEKQRSFCEAYAANGGNAMGAAREAGYAKPKQQGCQNLENPVIREAIEILRSEKTNAAIATREERQSFWTSVMRDSGQEMKDRLRAAELLGKAHADFLDRHEHSGPNGGPIRTAADLTDEQLAAIASTGR